MTYSLYGCRVNAERTLPIKPSSAPTGVDITVTFSPPNRCLGRNVRITYRSQSIVVRRTEAGHHFAYSDATEFLVSPNGNQIIAVTPPDSTFEDTCTYLVGPVMGFVLRLHGIVCLHASGVVIGGRAVAICGPPGAGKSTTAAALAQRGYPILAEDIAALDDQADCFCVQAGYPRVNVWPESAAALCGSAETLPAITPNWGKRYLPLDDSSGPLFHSSPAPLAAIYVLGERREQTHPEFQALHSVEALIALASNTYTPYLLDEAMRAREFDVLTRLVKHVPVRRVYPPCDFSNISHFCEGLLNDFASLP